MKLGQILSEALTFGQKEISMVKRESNNILVGIEFEWKLNEFQDEETFENDVRDELDALTRNWIELHANSLLQDVQVDASDFAREFTFLLTLTKNVAEHTRDLKETVDGAQADLFPVEAIEEKFRVLRDTVVAMRLSGIEDTVADMRGSPIEDIEMNLPEFGATIRLDSADLDNWKDEIDSFTANFSDTEEALDEITPEDDREDIVNTVYNEYMNYVEDLITYDILDVHNTMELSAQSMIEKNIEVPNSEAISREVDQYFTRRARELAEQEAEDIQDELRQDALDNVASRSSGDGSMEHARDTMEKLLDDEQIGDIQEVVTDGSVGSQGAEAISQPLPIDQAMEHMHKHLDIIKRHGYTDDDTGMHVNISFSDIEMTDDDLNPVKLLMLLDDEFIRKLHPIREYVQSNFWNMSPELMIMNASSSSALLKKNDYKPTPTVLEQMVLSILKKGDKHVGVNLLNLGAGVNMERRRVEFRYMGGADYENRGDEMEFNIYRFAYVLKAAFDDDFGRKEYLKELADFVNKKLQKQFNLDVRGFFNMLRKVDYITDNDILTIQDISQMATTNPQTLDERLSDVIERAASGRTQEAPEKKKANPVSIFKNYIIKDVEEVETAVQQTIYDMYKRIKKNQKNILDPSVHGRMDTTRLINLLRQVQDGRYRVEFHNFSSFSTNAFINQVLNTWWEEFGSRRTLMARQEEDILPLMKKYLLQHMSELMEESDGLITTIRREIGMEQI